MNFRSAAMWGLFAIMYSGGRLALSDNLSRTQMCQQLEQQLVLLESELAQLNKNFNERFAKMQALGAKVYAERVQYDKLGCGICGPGDFENKPKPCAPECTQFEGARKELNQLKGAFEGEKAKMKIAVEQNIKKKSEIKIELRDDKCTGTVK